MAENRYSKVHADPQGAGDARPTAIQIVEDEGLAGKMTDKSAFITGASQGIGVEIARALHVAGFTIYLGVRDIERSKKTVEDLESSPDSSNKAPIHLVKMSLDSLDSVRQAAKDVLAQTNKLSLLINNAGVMATPQGKTTDGFETQFGTNHLGHFLLFQELKPALLAGSTPEFNSRVVSVSSIGHQRNGVFLDDLALEKQKYDPWVSYGQAKTANILFANELDRRYGSRGIHAWSIHPGGIRTNLQKHVDNSIMDKWETPEFLKAFKSPAQGAATSVYAALAKELEGQGGKYLANCGHTVPISPGSGPLSEGTYSPWIYDADTEKKLWDQSCKMVGVAED